MQFFVEPIWSWPLTVLSSMGLFALTILNHQVQRQQGRGYRSLLWLRLLSALVLSIAMFRPAIQKTDNDDHPVQLQILSDISRSMNTADMPGGMTRFEAVRSDLSKNESKWKDFGKQVAVHHLDFARDLSPFDAKLSEGTGDQTAFGKVLEDSLRDSRNQRSLGLILLTDGANRAVPPYDADAFTAARKFGDSQIPIYAIGYGSSSLSTASLDLAIEDLRVDPIVFEKKLVPVSCKVRASGANGKKIRLRILVEDRAGKRPNESGVLKPAIATQQARTVREIDVTSNSETIPVDLSFVPTSPGEIKIAVEVEALDGELLTQNNRRESLLTVKKGGLNVAYFDQVLRPEQKFIRMVNGADKIQLDFHEIRSGKFANLTKIDQSWFQRGRYDVYIIGDVRAEWIGADNLKRLAARLEDGAGLLMIGGLQNFAVGGYASSPIADWLPVELNPTEFQPESNRPSTAAQINSEIKLVPTERGLRDYVMNLGSQDQNRTLWMNLPALNGANRLKPRNELVRIWAETPEKQPLLLVNQVASARVAAFGVDSTRLWYQAGHEELHQRFWRQMILWLAKKEEDKDQAIWVKVEPRNFSPGALAPLTFGARASDGSPLSDIDFEVDVTKPDGKHDKPGVKKAKDENLADFTSTTEPGDYWVQVVGRRKGQLLPDVGMTRFIVDARDLEMDYPSADYDFLKELSSLSGGTALKPEEFGELLDRLKQKKMTALTRTQTIPLWDNWGLLLLFVGLMSVEWFRRKKLGLV